MAPADGDIAPDDDASFWPWVGLGIGLCCLLLLIVLVVVLLRRRKAKAKKEDLGDHGLDEVWGTPAAGTMGAGRQSEYASTAAYLQEDTPVPGTVTDSIVYASMPQNESNRSVPESSIVYASFNGIPAPDNAVNNDSGTVVYSSFPPTQTQPIITYGKID
jgi:hypothetical protein